MAGRADDRRTEPDQWRAAGERIESLLDAAGAPGVAGPVARERAEQLLREVVGLYGAALARIVALTDDEATVERYAADNLVASLLLVHGLHPHDVFRRVADALDSVRPYLGSHGGDVELIDIVAGDHGDTAVLRFAGSCKSCPSSAVTLELAVSDAVRAAAPEICDIEVVTESAATAGPSVIPADTLLTRVRAQHATTWCPVPDLVALRAGEVGGFEVAGMPILACRVDEELFAYRDRCPSGDHSLAGAALLSSSGAGSALLRCAECGARFDVTHGGAGLDSAAVHLEPLPLLVHDGVLALALPDELTGLPA
jgi:Fe-S cluster biogenesis protein NfuA/nitrite reductase/ring-hydroxylating ferredoxin subunit